MTAATLLGIVAESGSTLHELVADVVVAPQILINVRCPRRDVLERPTVIAAVAAAEAALGSSGRLLIRPSGTEPLIRVMAEGDDGLMVQTVAAQLAAQIEQEIGRLTEI